MNNRGRIGPNLEGPGKLGSFSLLHVGMSADECFVVIVGNGIVGEHVGRHPFAGAAPGGEGIQENHPVLVLCHLQQFGHGFVDKGDRPVLAHHGQRTGKKKDYQEGK